MRKDTTSSTGLNQIFPRGIEVHEAYCDSLSQELTVARRRTRRESLAASAAHGKILPSNSHGLSPNSPDSKEIR